MTDAIAGTRLSRPDSDPRELRRQIVEKRFELIERRSEKHEERLDTHEKTIERIDRTIGESKAMIRAWLFAASVFWGLIVVITGVVVALVKK